MSSAILSETRGERKKEIESFKPASCSVAGVRNRATLTPSFSSSCYGLNRGANTATTKIEKENSEDFRCNGKLGHWILIRPRKELPSLS